MAIPSVSQYHSWLPIFSPWWPLTVFFCRLASKISTDWLELLRMISSLFSPWVNQFSQCQTSHLMCRTSPSTQMWRWGWGQPASCHPRASYAFHYSIWLPFGSPTQPNMKYEKDNSDKSLLADGPWCRLGYSCQDPRMPPLFIIFLSSLRIDPYV